MNDPLGAAGPLIACTVARRGRVTVAEPFFEPGPPLTLGRRGNTAVADGQLILVSPHGRGGGRLEEVLGPPADIHAVMHALAGEAGVADGWPEEALSELERLPADLLPAEGSRRDLRDLLTFTIDPAQARDFDDALSVEQRDGHTVVHVHIADVSAFVAPGGALDDEAERRSTSVYLPGRVDPMLPQPFCVQKRSESLVCPLLLGTEKNGTELLKDGQLVTLSCAEGDTGFVYEADQD